MVAVWEEDKHNRDGQGRFASDASAMELYHGTKKINVEHILQNGFKVNGSSDDFGRAVYFKSPIYDAKDHEDYKAKLADREARGFTINDKMRELRGEDTASVVNSFASASRADSAVMKALIPGDGVLDCTNGRPQELEELIEAYRHGDMNRRTRLTLRHAFGFEDDSLNDDEIWDVAEEREDELANKFGISSIGRLSPYEVYCKSKGYKAVVDKLDEYEEEGWQIGVYDPIALQIIDHGRKMDFTEAGAQLIKALQKKSLPYCLMHHEFDEHGDLVLHIGVITDEAVEKSLHTLRNFVRDWQSE
jgi:hypothetical protein